jgi:N utilization substance protein B
MSRKSTRAHAFRVIFQLSFFPREFYNRIFENYFNRFKNFKLTEKDIVRSEFFGIANNLDKIDGAIKIHSKWSINRLNKVDLALLRLAIYEMYFENNFHSVVISEVVNLANEYGSDSSVKFVNGILAKISADDIKDE